MAQPLPPAFRRGLSRSWNGRRRFFLLWRRLGRGRRLPPPVEHPAKETEFRLGGAIARVIVFCHSKSGFAIEDGAIKGWSRNARSGAVAAARLTAI
ncbi:hypothetical protein MPC4_50142 [Methylocella tundrae]|uniref:Uncharacterized protein n=1 Tax=Methylocella tundrae TaxID=227605 RepID=A0A8B6MA84_METTU|nr:hypothetical protein MPC1_3480003 [Methylocella tundrae]VTZ51834.1 hypothetical protein MPC4_50142 [Methylocella tundrae]